MKAMVTWSESLSLGDPEIDEQHRTLIGLLNGLYEAMLTGTARERLTLLISDLTAYTRLHFQNEERYFELFNYSELEAHTRVHKELTDRLAQLRDRHARGEEDLTVEMLLFLGNWVLEHVMLVDMRYKQFLAEVVRKREPLDHLGHVSREI